MRSYRKLIRIFFIFSLSCVWLQAEESTLDIISKESNSTLLNDELNLSIQHDITISVYNDIYTWNALGTGGSYRPLISSDLNVSAYDWNAVNSRWVNMRAAVLAALDLSQFYQNSNNLNQVGDMRNYNRIDVRGIRFGGIGTINFDKPWTYVGLVSLNSLAKDFDSSTTDTLTLFDAMLGIPLWGRYGRMQIGKMKAPISMERIMGMVFEQTMERPTHLDALLKSRNIGVTFSDLILDKKLTWRIGFFNNWLDDKALSFSQADQEVVARVTTVAFEDKEKERLLHLGAGYRYLDAREGTLQYAVGPEQWFVDPWVDTGIFSAEASHTLNMEISYLDGPFWFASEYTYTSVESIENGNPHFSGYHLTLNYFLTGDHRGYNKRKGAVRRITPIVDFTNGGWGAVEVSARYSSLDLSDKAIDGGIIDISSLGLIWHPRRDTQFHMQWSHVKLDRKAITTGLAPVKSDSDILQFRVVVVID